MMSSNEKPWAWDPLVRITHWGIAATVILNGLILEEGEEFHVLVGYAALSLLALRLVWGFVGTEEARFSAFPASPGAATAHIRGILSGRVERHPSHNPLGALMVYALWATLAVVVATGLAMEADVLPEGGESYAADAPEAMPGARIILADYDGHEEGLGDGEGGGKVLEEVHEAAANLILLLALLHVGGVVFEMARGDRGLVRRMITGQGDGGQGT